MAETCDVVVTIGEAKLFNQRLTVPELRTTMDFTAVPEWTLLGISMDRLAELRALGLDVWVQRSYRDGEVVMDAIGDGRPIEVTGVVDAAAGDADNATQVSGEAAVAEAETAVAAAGETAEAQTAETETAPPGKGRGRNRSTT